MKASDDGHSASFSQAAGNNSGKIAHIQNVSISTDFGREDILELGSKKFLTLELLTSLLKLHVKLVYCNRR